MPDVSKHQTTAMPAAGAQALPVSVRGFQRGWRSDPVPLALTSAFLWHVLTLRAADITRKGFVSYFALFSGQSGHTGSLFFAPLSRMMQPLHLQKRLLCSCCLPFCGCPTQKKVCPVVFQDLDLEANCLVELLWDNGASFCPF